MFDLYTGVNISNPFNNAKKHEQHKAFRHAHAGRWDYHPLSQQKRHIHTCTRLFTVWALFGGTTSSRTSYMMTNGFVGGVGDVVTTDSTPVATILEVKSTGGSIVFTGT